MITTLNSIAFTVKSLTSARFILILSCTDVSAALFTIKVMQFHKIRACFTLLAFKFCHLIAYFFKSIQLFT